MSDLLWVAVGASVGAPLRFALGLRFDGVLPWGTLAVNVAASLVLGMCVGWPVGDVTTALVGAGFCGGMSTYSSFAVQTRDHGAGAGTGYAVATVCLGLAAAAAGYGLTA